MTTAKIEKSQPEEAAASKKSDSGEKPVLAEASLATPTATPAPTPTPTTTTATPTTRAAPAPERSAQASYQSNGPATVGGSSRRAFGFGAVSALILAGAIVGLSGGENSGLVQSLQIELADTKAAYISLQVEVAQTKVAALSSQLGDIVAAETQLSQLVAEKKITLDQLAAANSSLPGLLDSEAISPPVAEVVEKTPLIEALSTAELSPAALSTEVLAPLVGGESSSGSGDAGIVVELPEIGKIEIAPLPTVDAK